MKKIILTIGIILTSMPFCCAQTITLKFTARDATLRHVQLNRVTITNISKGWQENIFWPDTTFMLQNSTGIQGTEALPVSSLQLAQNNPNPFTKATDVNLTVAEAGMVALEITDVNGRIVAGTEHYSSLSTGVHQFHVTLSTAGTYVMTARQNGQISSIKMVCHGGENNNSIEYAGMVLAPNFSPQQKILVTQPFDIGDQMEYVGYATMAYHLDG